MSAREVVRLIYAPHKAFKEIIQNPRYIGPLLIMILFVIANVGFGYVQLSKRYMDQTVPVLDSPELDKWTENSTFWSSSALAPTENTSDYINGTYYGDKSIEFKAVSSSQIWIQLNISSSPLNCSGAQSYKNLTFRIKMVDVETPPSNVSLYLLSTNPQDNFYYNLTDKLSAINVWNNITLSVGPESQGWKNSTNNAEWSNITGVKLDFAWPSELNITLLVDGFFFHGLYKPLIETSSSYLVSFPISASMQFIIQWVLLGGVLYLVPKLFNLKTVWKTLLIVAGFALITLFIQTIVFTAVSLTWPDFFVSLKFLGGVPGESYEAYTQIFGQFFTIIWYIDKVMWVWIIALCAIALKLVFEVSWLKSLLIAVLSYLLYIFVLLLLVPGLVYI